jgi:hypothetical protein
MRSQSRTGFTLIELMVAMALTMFVMVILSQAFVLALETFSNMTGVGTMVSNLRTFEVLFRDDVGQDHFEGKRRLSDLNMLGQPQIVVAPPEAGFLALRQPTAAGSATYVSEGNDANGLPSYRAVDQYIYMTVKRKGNQQQSFFTAALSGGPNVLTPFFSRQTAYNMLPQANGSATPDLPNSTWTTPYPNNGGGGPTAFYSSQWAEVVYYLVRTGTTEEANNPASLSGTPTFSLYRAEFVMVPDGTNVSTIYTPPTFNPVLLSQSSFAAMSCNPGGVAAPVLQFYSPADAAQSRRMISDLTAFTPGKPLAAFNAVEARIHLNATLVVPNVLSFEVQAMRIGEVSFTGYGGTTLNLYDTAKFGTAGYPQIGLKAIQATLRVWDSKTRQTRQVTVVQDL